MSKGTSHITKRNLTLPQVLMENAAVYGDAKTAIREKAYGIWQKYTWADYGRYVRMTAAGLAALNLRRGENLCMVVHNHPEWLFSEPVSYTHLTLPTIYPV